MLKVKLPYESPISPRYNPNRTENVCSYKKLYTNVTATLFIVDKKWKQSKCPKDGNKKYLGIKGFFKNQCISGTIHPVEKQTNELLMYATMGMNLENIN